MRKRPRDFTGPYEICLLPLLAVFLLAFIPNAHAQSLEFDSEFGGFGAALGQFQEPQGVTVDSQGRIIVAGGANQRIQLCNDQGQCTSFGSGGTGPGQFSYPADVAVDSQDRIIVADQDAARIYVCDDQGTCSEFGNLGSNPGQFNNPSGVAVDSQNRIIVADTNNHRIQICDHQGICSAFGSFGTAPGQFNSPWGIAVDSQDRIIVAEWQNHRIQICDDQGSCTAFGSKGTAPGQFDEPTGVAVDRQDRIVVAEIFNHRFQVCSNQGVCTAYGSQGNGPGQFERPTGVAVDSQGRVFVADWDNNRIQIWRDTTAAVFTINPGVNDAWFEPATAGQGFFINVFEDIGQMFVAWFTYDTQRPDASITAHLGEPGHRWLTAQGPYAGNQAVLDITFSSGGMFDTPIAIGQVQDGTLIVEFTDCNSGTVSYDIPSIAAQGVVPIQRVALDNVPGCEAQVTLAQSPEIKRFTSSKSSNVIETQSQAAFFQINPGLNDAWFKPETAGQGFFINVFKNLGQMFVAWFTYDTERPDESITAQLGEPGHRWLTAQGPYADNQAVLDITFSSGGIFDTPTDIENVQDGTLLIEFNNCNSGTITYDIPSIGVQGVVPIQRIVLDNMPGCEEQDNQSNLTVKKVGTGSGSVTSNPAGITCDTKCSEPFTPGTSVTLTGTSSEGSIFTGFGGGGCSGTDPCTLVLNSDVVVTANFIELAKGLEITALSSTNIMPMELLNVSGSGFDPQNSAISVLLIPPEPDVTIAIPVISALSDSVDIVVPPYIDELSGTFSSGIVDVQVVQESGGFLMTSNVIQGLNISQLPILDSSILPGMITSMFIAAGQDSLVEAKSLIDIASDPEKFSNAIDVISPELVSLQEQIVAVIIDPSKTVTLTTINEESVEIDDSDMAELDRLISNFFLSFEKSIVEDAFTSKKTRLLTITKTNSAKSKQSVNCSSQYQDLKGLGAGTFDQLVKACELTEKKKERADQIRKDMPMWALIAYGPILAISASARTGGIVALTRATTVGKLFIGLLDAWLADVARGATPTLQKSIDNLNEALIDEFLGIDVFKFTKAARDLISASNKFTNGQEPQLGVILMDISESKSEGQDIAWVIKKMGEQQSIEQIEIPEGQGTYENEDIRRAPVNQPILFVTDSTLSFGDLEVGNSSTLQFEISNDGGGLLTGTATTSAPFSVLSGGDFTHGLEPQIRHTVTVQFSPTGSGDFTGSLSIGSNGGNATVRLSGTGLAIPEPVPILAVSTISIGFVSVDVGGGTSESFTVSNIGEGTLTGSVSTSAPFGITSGASFSLGPSQSQTVTAGFTQSQADPLSSLLSQTVSVSFNPISAGDFSGSATVSSNGGNAAVALSGTGLPAPPMNAFLAVGVDPSEGGSVTGTGINCPGDCSETYPINETPVNVTLIASPDTANGFAFTGWSGDCSGTGSCALTMDADKGVVANFGNTLNWTLNANWSASVAGGVGGSCNPTFLLPRNGGSAPFSCGDATATFSTTATIITISGLGSASGTGFSCTGTGGGSSAISESASEFSGGGSISGSVTCNYDDGTSETSAVTGSFTASAPKGSP